MTFEEKTNKLIKHLTDLTDNDYNPLTVTKEVVNDMNLIIHKYGVTLNPKKVEIIYKDRWVKFLGFNIKGDQITLSKSRVKSFQKEIK